MNQTALIPMSDQMPAYLQAAGAIGNENIDASTLATPRLYLLQDLSPQQQRGNPMYVPGAQAGMFLDSISGKTYDELFVSNLFMTKGWNVNKKRVFGQKEWKGFHDSIDAAMARLTTDGVNPGDYDIVETHTHTLAIIDPVLGTVVTPIQFSMKSTGTRESKDWNSKIVTQGPDKPRFASIWKLGCRLTSNPKGSWYTAVPSFAGWAPESLFNELHNLFIGLRGNVQVTEADAF